MTDIVERLQENILADAFKDKVISSGKLTERLIYERRDAADEIERLRKVIIQAIAEDGTSLESMMQRRGGS